MVVYQVGDAEEQFDTSFLKTLRRHQVCCEKGVYGWYVLARDVEAKFQFEMATSYEERIYLYIGTVTDKEGKSVTSRFIGELFGAQISTDKHKSFDTDFAVSCAVAFLCEKQLNVYFHVLSTENRREVEIASSKDPILQKVTPRKVSLRPEIKRRIRAGMDLGKEIVEVGVAVQKLLEQRLAAPRNPPPASGSPANVEKVCKGRELAETLKPAKLPEDEATAWYRDLRNARETLRRRPGPREAGES